MNTLEQIEQDGRRKAGELLALVESGDAVELKYFRLALTSNNSIDLVFTQDDYYRLRSLLGSNKLGAFGFEILNDSPNAPSVTIWLRADVLCYIKEHRYLRVFLVDNQTISVEAKYFREG